MAFRRPLFLTSGNLQEMSNTQINEIKSEMFWQYISLPSVTLSVVASGGSVGTIYDTRLQAGDYSTAVSDYVAETSTAEPTTVSVAYSRIQETVSTVSVPDNTNNVRYPLYRTTAGQLQTMSLQDMYDTFAYDTIDSLVVGGAVYTISTGTSLTDYTLVSTTPVFSDTRADTSAYTAAGIPEALDQPTTITNYYLFKRNSSSATFTNPVQATASGHIQPIDTASMQTILSQVIRYAAYAATDYKIRYNYNGSGNNNGSGMSDTKLNGSGNWQTYLAGGDDYRSQEFPDGTPITINTYYLRVAKT